MCGHCGSYKYKNTWTDELFSEVLRRFIKSVYLISNELEKIDINAECKEIKDGMKCKIYISGFIGEKEITEEHEIQVHLKKTVCDVCSKKFGGYHEAIIQIRSDRAFIKDELKNMTLSVENLVENLQAKGNRTLFIADIDMEHGGLDFFISDKQAAQVITKKLQEKYNGTIKQSSKNIGMRDGKQIYRNTYLLRLPSYKKGDFIKLEKNLYKILSTRGNKVKILDISTWEEKIIEPKKLQKTETIDRKDNIKEMIVVDQNKDEVQIMDEKTYEIKTIKKPRPFNFVKEKIKTINLDDKTFLIP
jgi:nonsense-mediated mRNA decay protein 3